MSEVWRERFSQVTHLCQACLTGRSQSLCELCSLLDEVGYFHYDGLWPVKSMWPDNIQQGI